MAALSGDLIDTDVSKFPKITVREPVGYRLLDSSSHRTPGTTKQPCHLLPGQDTGPDRQRDHQRSGHALLAAHPRHRFDMDAVANRTTHSPGPVSELHGNPPHRHMTKASHGACISIRCRLKTLTAAWYKALIRNDCRHQSRHSTFDCDNTKSLQFDRLFDQTFNEHESPLRYLVGFATSMYLMRLMLFNYSTVSPCTDS